jgi:leader peptidase (prepilin peptidase) / N-methyltransferase
MVSAGSGRVSPRINWRRALLWIVASGVPIAASILLIPDIRGVFGGGLALLMVAIASADASEYVIPDGLTLLALILGVVNASIEPSHNVTQDVALAALRGAALALAFLALRIGYRRLRGRQGLGLGDVKLAGVCGLWLDWFTIPIAVEIAALSALSVYLLRQFVLRRPVRATARLPFGVFFAPAIWLAWLIEVTMLIPL